MAENTYYTDVTGIPTTSQGAQEAATEAATDGAQDCAPAANIMKDFTTEEEGVQGCVPDDADIEAVNKAKIMVILSANGMAANQISSIIKDIYEFAKEVLNEEHRREYDQLPSDGGTASVYDVITRIFLKGMPDDLKTVDDITTNAAALYQALHRDVGLENVIRSKGQKVKVCDEIPDMQCAQLLIGALPPNMIACVSVYTDFSMAELAVRVDDPDHPNFGLYEFARENTINHIKSLIWKVNGAASSAYVHMVFEKLREMVPQVHPSHDPMKWCPCNNGVYDRENKRFIPYDSDEYRRSGLVFVWKHHSDYKDDALNQIPECTMSDGSTMNFEEWMQSIAVDENGTPDPKIKELLWQGLACVVWPGQVKQALWLLGPAANNAKSTYRDLCLAVTGKTNVTAIPPEGIDQRFGLQDLVDPIPKPLIYPDDTAATYIEKMALLKSVISGKDIRVERKNMTSVSYVPDSVTMIVNGNGMPKSQEKGNSVTRRIAIAPMNANFEGREDPEVDKFLKRRDVAEYVLAKCISMEPFKKYAVSELTLEAKYEWLADNDPVMEFMDLYATPYEIDGYCVGCDDCDDKHTDTSYSTNKPVVNITVYVTDLLWDFVPMTILHAAYVDYARKTNPSGVTLSLSTFSKSVKKWCDLHPEYWKSDRRYVGTQDFKNPTKLHDFSYPIEGNMLNVYNASISAAVDLGYHCSKQVRGISRIIPTHIASVEGVRSNYYELPIPLGTAKDDETKKNG